jgi:septal ring factor EnvC (AmiA/AmiB activator)
MPQQSSTRIDVSKEEERYLRRAFRRFAVPYVFVFAALAWATTTLMSKDDPAASSAELSSLRENLAALEQSVAALQARLDKVGAETERAANRVGALETRKPTRDSAAAVDMEGLERSLRDANRRIADLERDGGSGATAAERIDALTARMQRIEAIARSAPPPAPAPVPVPAAPAPAPAP